MRYLITLLIIGLCLTIAEATQPADVQLNSGLRITPFAVPVATPVTIAQQGQVFYFYQNQRPNQQYSTPQSSDLWSEFEQFRKWKITQQKKIKLRDDPTVDKKPLKNNPTHSPADPSDHQQIEQILKTVCYQCHRGNTAKGDFRLDEHLTAELRLKAIEQVVRGDMPKGKKLSALQVGRVLLELSQEQDEVKK